MRNPFLLQLRLPLLLRLLRVTLSNDHGAVPEKPHQELHWETPLPPLLRVFERQSKPDPRVRLLLPVFL